MHDTEEPCGTEITKIIFQEKVQIFLKFELLGSMGQRRNAALYNLLQSLRVLGFSQTRLTNRYFSKVFLYHEKIITGIEITQRALLCPIFILTITVC